MFASLKFRDAFAFPVGHGLAPQLLNTGSIGGTIVPVTASANIHRRWAFLILTGSGATTTVWDAWIGGASASAGTYSALPATSMATLSGSASLGVGQYGSNKAILLETRGEYLQGLNSGITWIRPIISVTTASAYAACVALGYLGGYRPAKDYDVNTLYCVEVDAF